MTVFVGDIFQAIASVLADVVVVITVIVLNHVVMMKERIGKSILRMNWIWEAVLRLRGMLGWEVVLGR